MNWTKEEKDQEELDRYNKMIELNESIIQEMNA